MKKIILTFFILLSIPINTFAWCLIQWWPADVLLELVKNNQIVMANIAWAEPLASWWNSTISSKSFITKFQWNMEGVFNDLFSFRTYDSYVQYFAIFPMLNEIPVEVERDYVLLNSEITRQIEFLKKIAKQWKMDYIVENPCEWIDGICEFKKWVTVRVAIWELLKNTDDIIDLYRWTVVWEQHNSKIWDYSLTTNNFKLEIEKHYSQWAYNLCSQEDWFKATVDEAIISIKWLVTSAEDGIKEWREAWAMLFDSTPSEEAELEKKLLKEYLSDIWLDNDEWAIIIANLEKYNLEWLSVNNNFVTNTFKLIENNIADEVESFKTEVLWDFTEEEDMSLDEIKYRSNNAKSTKEIQERIIRMYETELPFAAIWDINTEELRANIIETHSSLDIWIRILNRWIPKSQKICNSQWWGWICQ